MTGTLSTWRERMLKLADYVGWRRYVIALTFGIVTAMAFAPLRWPIALAVGLSGLALLLEGVGRREKPRRVAFFTGTAFGAGYFAYGMLWLANAFMVQADQFAWMIPIVLPGFFAFLGLFYGLASWVYISLREKYSIRGLSTLLLFAITLSVAEWLRGHILSGLPWNLHAQALAGTTIGLQPLTVLGPYGYGFLLTLIALTPAMAFLHAQQARKVGLFTLASVATIVAFSAVRLSLHPEERRTDAQIAILQPSVSQRDKLDPSKRGENLRQILEMSTRAANKLASEDLNASIYIIWPENASPFLNQIPDLSDYLSDELPAKSWLISGSLRSVPEGYANTLFVYGPSESGANEAAVYDKHRLVPFGETLPFYQAFEALGIESLSPTGGRGFIPGTGPKTLGLGPAPFSPLICYEDVFPGTLYRRGDRPDWLTVVTNDAWFGDRAGPMQHLDIARMRAVENGLPLVRSANTGISALIDAEGRVLYDLPLYQPGVITAALPAPRPRTAYTVTGDLTFAAMLSFFGLLVVRNALQAMREKGNFTA
ncbi:MAG: apolipoprotein N-acyltransferase [Pseudomonadota bacterium]